MGSKIRTIEPQLKLSGSYKKSVLYFYSNLAAENVAQWNEFYFECKTINILNKNTVHCHVFTA